MAQDFFFCFTQKTQIEGAFKTLSLLYVLLYIYKLFIESANGFTSILRLSFWLRVALMLKLIKQLAKAQGRCEQQAQEKIHQ